MYVKAETIFFVCENGVTRMSSALIIKMGEALYAIVTYVENLPHGFSFVASSPS